MKELWLKGPVEFRRQEIKKNFCLDYIIVKIKNIKEKILIAPREEYKISVKIDIRFFNSQC